MPRGAQTGSRAAGPSARQCRIWSGLVGLALVAMVVGSVMLYRHVDALPAKGSNMGAAFALGGILASGAGVVLAMIGLVGARRAAVVGAGVALLAAGSLAALPLLALVTGNT